MAVSQVTLGYPSGSKLYVNTDLEGAAVDVIKASGATVYAISVDNSANAAEAEFLKFYDTAGAVVVGTTVPDFVLPIPAAAVFDVVFPAGLVFANGLKVLGTTTGGTICTASPTASLIARVVYA